MDNNDQSRGGRRFVYRRGNSRGRGNVNNTGDDLQQGSPQPGPSRGYYTRPLFTDNNNPPGPPRKRGRRMDDALNSGNNSSLEDLKSKLKKILPGYDYYYPEEPPCNIPDPELKIAAVENLLTRLDFAKHKNNVVCKYKKNSREEYTVSINYDKIVENEEFLMQWQNFESSLFNDPEDIISLWSATAHMFLVKAALRNNTNDDDVEEEREEQEQQEQVDNDIMLLQNKVMKIRLGIQKSAPIVPIIKLSSSYLGKYVSINGAVASSENIKPYIVRLTFKCRVCEEKFSVKQINGHYTAPVVCKASEDCKSKSGFEVDETAKTTIYVDSRRIRIQDLPRGDDERGSVPKAINCLLLGNLANQCSTGDLVHISGIYKIGVLPKQSKHEGYIEVHALEQERDSERVADTANCNILTSREDDQTAIRKINEEPQLFRLLCASLCPSVFGLDMIKAGILLSLFGGRTVTEGLTRRRSDINLLMIGDPGIGKSQCLKAIKNVAPKCVYVCGTSTTVAGLTVTLSKDGDDYSLDGGAMVIADQGVCCIDEFDKMSSQHHALLEALEQQCVSVAKCGMQRTLPARATVIAAANPVGGHYDKTKTMYENIKIKPAVLSRFDLMFILLDKPDLKLDERLVTHGANLRMGEADGTNLGAGNNTTTPSPSPISSNIRRAEESAHLYYRIRTRWGEVMDLIPPILIRKYIAYAKEHVSPILTAEAVEVLKTFYLKLRMERKQAHSAPVTPRQLESLKRLAEARSKVELRENVTAQDARDAVDIFDYSINNGIDNDMERANNVLLHSYLSPDSNRSGEPGPSRPRTIKAQAKRLVKALQDEVRGDNRNLLTLGDIKRVIAQLGFNENADRLIESLNTVGYLLMQGGGFYKLIVGDL